MLAATTMPSSEIVRDDLLHRDALEVFVDGAVGQGHSYHRDLRPRRRVTPIQSHPFTWWMSMLHGPTPSVTSDAPRCPRQSGCRARRPTRLQGERTGALVEARDAGAEDRAGPRMHECLSPCCRLCGPHVSPRSAGPWSQAGWVPRGSRLAWNGRSSVPHWRSHPQMRRRPPWFRSRRQVATFFSTQVGTGRLGTSSRPFLRYILTGASIVGVPWASRCTLVASQRPCGGGGCGLSMVAR